MMKRYEWLLFDLDHTLLDTDTAERLALEKIFKTVTDDVTEEMVAVYKDINRKLWKMLEQGEIESETIKYKRFEDWLTHYGMDGDPKTIGYAYLDALSEGSQLFEGALELVEKLSKKYRLAVITNGIVHVQKPRLEASGLKPYFKKLFISEEIGVSKPAVEFFDIVLKGIGAKKEECLVIGDSMSSDIKGGLDSLIDTCHMNFHHKKEAPYASTYTACSYQELLELLE
ncbi:noncanonical pyrimidine nucleotidase, YjjG family [Fusibacter sp. A1]|nr:YjjG family noncanonical pyrimidine nucleotidase [Fusibacter sp. A2]RXV59212.1 noncanonical pyrimidine nucleotidase, YjjG family [Fusibacter sp. A1]